MTNLNVLGFPKLPRPESNPSVLDQPMVTLPAEAEDSPSGQLPLLEQPFHGFKPDKIDPSEASVTPSRPVPEIISLDQQVFDPTARCYPLRVREHKRQWGMQATTSPEVEIYEPTDYKNAMSSPEAHL